MYRLLTFSDWTNISLDEVEARGPVIHLNSQISLPFYRFPQLGDEEGWAEITADLQQVAKDHSRFEAESAKSALDEILEYLQRDAGNPGAPYQLVEAGWISAKDLDTYDLLAIVTLCNALARRRERAASEAGGIWQGRAAPRVSSTREHEAQAILKMLIDTDSVPRQCLRNGKIVLAKIAAVIAPMVDMRVDSCKHACRDQVRQFNSTVGYRTT